MNRISRLGIPLLISISIIGVSKLTYANNESNSPDLNVYQTSNGVKAEWAVDMLEEDILYQTSFEDNDELPNLIYGSIDKGGGRTGGQSFSSEDSYTGEKSLKVEDTFTNGQISGDPINGVVPFSNTSRTIFTNKKYIDNGIDLSMSLKVKTTGEGKIKPQAQGVNDRYGIVMKETFLEDVKVGDYTIKVSDISIFKPYVDKKTVFYIADRKEYYNPIYPVAYNEKNSTITMNLPFAGSFKKGDNLIQRRYLIPLQFPERVVNSKEWTTINMNTKVPSYSYYDIKKEGFSFVLFNTIENKMYIDDLKMGYATETELYRDNNLIYKGKLSDYEDKSAIDKEKPNIVEEYNVSIENGKEYIKIDEPNDKGTIYTYQLKAISNDKSNVYYSNEEKIEVKSGIKGYSYIISKDKNQDPSGLINNYDGKIEVTNEVYKDHYLHIQSIDNSGNKSEVNHIKLDKLIDKDSPILTLTQTPDGWTNKNVTINVNAEDKKSGIKKISYKGENMIENSDFLEGGKGWGTQATFGVWEVNNGILSLNDNTVNINKVYKENAFKGSAVGAKYLVELEVRGKGTLVVRYGINSGATRPVESRTKIDNDEFKTYIFEVERYDFSNDNLIVEREGKDGHLDFNKIEVYEHKDITESQKLEVSINGKYNFIAEDNAGNYKEESIVINNIDKTAPSLSVIQNNNDKTHENITLNINANDEESGIKSIMYIGDNVIKNGNFSEGLNYWHEDKPVPGTIGAGDISIRNGYLYLGDNRVNVNKAEQRDVFIDTAIGTKFYAEVIARGVGIINARYAMISGPHQENHKQNLISPIDFHLYKFGIERGINARDVFMIERRSKEGWIEVKDVKVFAQKDITASRELEVVENGIYTFVVEDNAGNITTVTHEVDNIVRELSMTLPAIKNIDIQIGDISEGESSIDNLVITDWRTKQNNDWKLSIEADGSNIPKGSISISEIKSIINRDGEEGEFTKLINKETYIDDGPVHLLYAKKARGEYELEFNKKALNVKLNNYSAKNGSENIKLLWTLESTPIVN